ncbi:hypothetical protein [Hyphomonas oceanitis]|nr:hypothetical protein [Hyphomonas oceanitis]
MNWNTFGRGMAVSAIALSVAGIASAQVTTSSMRGQVTNAEGAAVPNATGRHHTHAFGYDVRRCYQRER